MSAQAEPKALQPYGQDAGGQPIEPQAGLQQASPAASQPDRPAATPQGADLFGFDLVSLTRSAAQLRADKTAFSHSSAPRPDSANSLWNETTSYRTFQTMVNDYAGALTLFGVEAGEVLLVTGCLTGRSIAAMLAGLSLGMDVAITGMHLDSDELGEFAGFINASAIITEAGSHETAYGGQILSAAAACASVRLVISVADEAPDGMIAMSAAGPNTERPGKAAASARIITRNMQGAPVIHNQQTILAAGLDYVARARISAAAPIVSTILPASFAGLVCGPVAGLLTGAPVLLHAPFDSATLLACIADNAPVQLVAPGGISQHLAASGVCTSDQLAALILLTRTTAAPASLSALELPVISAGDVAICDLVAFDEIATAAQARGDDGAAQQPLGQNHVIAFDGREIIAIRAVKHLLDNNGIRTTGIAFEGAAVSKLDWKFYEAGE